jgi:hypothetical protein
VPPEPRVSALGGFGVSIGETAHCYPGGDPQRSERAAYRREVPLERWVERVVTQSKTEPEEDGRRNGRKKPPPRDQQADDEACAEKEDEDCEVNPLDRHASLRGERHNTRSRERLTEPREDRQAGVERYPRDSPHAEGREAVVVLQPPELALEGRASPVEAPEPLGRAGNERVATVRLETERGWHAPDGQRHFVRFRLKSAPANVHSPCSQASGFGRSVSPGLRRRAMVGTVPRSMHASWTGL